MKFNSLITEIVIFFFILLFLILPPLFGEQVNVDLSLVFTWTFPLQQLLMAIFSLCILLFYHKSRKQKINIFGFRIFFTLGILFCSYFLISFLSMVIPNNSPVINPIPLPSTFVTWIFCILNFMFGAFYEEVIYRFYFTDTLLDILNNINPLFDKKITKIICEIITALLFASAHYYMGIFAVLNALIAHFALRYTYKKSNSIIPGVIAHFLYNMISLILL